MIELNLESFFGRMDYYPIALIGTALLGLFGYFLLPKGQKKSKPIKLSLWIVVLIAFYENLGGLIVSQGISNSWVYNLFNSHVATVLFLLLIKSFLKQRNHQISINVFIVFFFSVSTVLHLKGISHYNDGGEYISFLNTVLILCSCGLYFYELITLDEFLEVNPLREFSFWASTAILFYFSSSFMIYISFTYLYTNHPEIFWMVREIPRIMAILCNLLLCLSIYTLVLKAKFQVEIIHV